MSAETRAKAASLGGWGKVASAADGPRYALARPGLRRRCHFCRGANKVTHLGMANGVALCGGCELCIARWVKDGYDAFKHEDEPCLRCPDSQRFHDASGCRNCGCLGFVGPS